MCYLPVLAVLASVVTLGYCSDLKVTAEAWFDIEIKDFDGPGEDYRGRIVIGLFGDTTPMTAMNFCELTNGSERKGKTKGGKKLHFKNTFFHRLVQDFVLQGGDVTIGDGTGGKSIFGDKFVDENFHVSHKAAGYVSMANHGSDTNGSQFFIILNSQRWLDGKHVCFGKVIKGMDTVKAMNEVPVVEGLSKPKNKIKIIDCGCDALPTDKQFELTEKESESCDDVERDD